jgi:hypothetical protein
VEATIQIANTSLIFRAFFSMLFGFSTVHFWQTTISVALPGLLGSDPNAVV